MTERDQTGRGSAVRLRSAAVGIVEVKAVGEEQDRARLRPHRLKPFGLGARMKQRRAHPVGRQLANPSRNLIPMERRVEPHTAFPRAAKAILLGWDIALGAGPWAWPRGSRIEVKR